MASFARCFDATGDVVEGRPAEIRIGDSVVMVSAVGARAAFSAFLYVYVADADASYGRAVAAGDELSETERQIADLVAKGLSNKEVAAALSLSPKTVEWNLSKVYAKLGVRSRTELARTFQPEP